MSRKWKPLPTHLPGWGWEKSLHSTGNEISKRKRKRLKKKQKWLQYQKIRYFKSEHPEPKPAKKPTPKTSSLTKVLRIELPNPFVGDGILLSEWHRTHGKWSCTKADATVDWFTRVRHPEVVLKWMKDHHYFYTWLNAKLAGTAVTPPAEDRPAEAYPPLPASAPQGENTVPSLNTPPQTAQRLCSGAG